MHEEAFPAVHYKLSIPFPGALGGRALEAVKVFFFFFKCMYVCICMYIFDGPIMVI